MSDPARQIMAVRLLGITGYDVLVAVLDTHSGRLHRYTLWSLRIGGGWDPRHQNDNATGCAVVLGRELPLKDCRRIVKERKKLVW